jgi:hypothetical protein
MTSTPTLQNFTSSLLVQNTAVIIPNGQTLSSAISTIATTVVGIYVPSTFTTGFIQFQVSQDGITYWPLYDTSGNAEGIDVVILNSAVWIAPIILAGFNNIKFNAATPQTGDQTLLLALRAI